MADAAQTSPYKKNWGKSPWNIDFHPERHALPSQVDYAVIGGGFTGLATAAWLRRLAPAKSVCVFEAEHIGAGASRNTGGMVLPESSAGDLPDLGDVLGGFAQTLKELSVDCDLDLRGAWEIGRSGGIKNSPISWNDSGKLRVVNELAGGTADPGKLVSGLGRAAQQAGARIHEGTRIDEIVFEGALRLRSGDKEIRADNVLVATNALSLELGGMVGRAHPMFTLSVATKPLEPAALEVLGLDAGKSFYTVDLPYLWGRMLPNGGVLFGSGLVNVNDWRELNEIDIGSGKAAELIARIEMRERGLDPVLGSVESTHWWGGPILIAEDWQPIFTHHAKSERVTVLGAYAGQGVALSVYLGRWAAEAMAGLRPLPQW